tara:strand:- start:155 stop:331 length:177 start_codon:yes stop_codon:yes gene_type:complete
LANSKRNEEILKALRDYTKDKASTKKSAQKTLVKEGIYTSKGLLRAEYRSPNKSKASA